MRIEITETGSEEFYREVVNVVCQYQSLIRKPERKLRNLFGSLRRNMAIGAAFLMILTAMSILWGRDRMMTAAITLMAFVIVFSGAYLFNLNRLLKNLMNDRRTAVLTLDETGVELNKEDSQTVKMGWNNVAFVREFKESMCFFSKDSMGFVISVSLRHRKQIMGYLKENPTGVRIIE